MRTIVALQRPTAVAAIRIAPAPPQWHPLKPGDDEVIATLRPAGSPIHENMLGEWESWVIGGAFRDRSAAAGLPRIVVIGDPIGASRVWPPNTRLPERSPAALHTFRRHVREALRGLPVRIAYLETAAPDGYTALIGLQTAHPGRFLEQGDQAAVQALSRLHSDGWFIAVYDRHGHLIQVGGNGARMSIGGSETVDPRYYGCRNPDEFGEPPAPGLAPPLFCPTDWRPAASTPPRPLRLIPAIASWMRGALTADGTENVPFRPGLRFGVGFGLQNMNGAPIRLRSITVGGAPGTAIRFAGLRLQVPASRLHTGRAGRLLPPYGPLPALRPVTIRPGNWVGVAMHFRVASCTPATSGRTLVSDRSVRVSWRLDGRVMSHTYDSVPLRIHVATC